MTYAIGKNVETCAGPTDCWQPAEVTTRHALVQEDGTIDTIIELGWCLEHGVNE